MEEYMKSFNVEAYNGMLFVGSKEPKTPARQVIKNIEDLLIFIIQNERQAETPLDFWEKNGIPVDLNGCFSATAPHKDVVIKYWEKLTK